MPNICRFCGRKMILNKTDEKGYRTWKCRKGCPQDKKTKKTSYFKRQGKVFLLPLIVLYTLFLVSFVTASINVTLLFPVNNFESLVPTINFNCSSNSSVNNIANVSLWTNQSGTMVLKNLSSNKFLETLNMSAFLNTPAGGYDTPSTGIFIEVSRNTTLKNIEVAHGGTDLTRVRVFNFTTGVAILVATSSVASYPTNANATFNLFLVKGQNYSIEVDNSGANYINVRSGIPFPFSEYKNLNINITHGIDGTNHIDPLARIWSVEGITTTNDTTYSIDNFENLITSPTNWTCQSCERDGICYFSNINRTVNLDLSLPIINIYYPYGTINYGYVGQNISLNFSATDLSIDKCWYNYNGINTIIPCSINNSLILTTNKTLILYANDTNNNVVSNTTIWNYSLFLNQQIYSLSTTEGNIENFTINFTILDTNILNSIYFYYNNTKYNPSLDFEGTNYIALQTINIPAINSNTNNTFFWNINTASVSINSTKINQSALNINIDDCSANSLKILNLTLYDEETQALIPSGVAGNGTIEVDMLIYPIGYSTPIINFSKTYNATNNASVCLSAGSLNNSQYTMNAQIRYTATGYDTEFYNIQSYHLTNSTALQNIKLYPLLTTLATEFLITIKDSSFLAVSNALIMIQRKYIGDGVYRNVEIPLSDNIGQAIGHFNTNSVVYRITIVKDGVTLMVFDGVTIVCTDATLGQCYLNLNQPSSSSGFTNMYSYGNLNYNMSFSGRIITINFNTIDGSVASLLLNATQYGTGNLLCSNSLVSSSGSFSCSIPASYGNTTIISELFSSNILVARGIFIIAVTPTQAGSSDAFFFLIVLLISIPMLFITDKRFLLVGVFMVFVIAMGLGIYMQSSWLGIGSAITWLIIALGIIAWKLSLRSGEVRE